MSKLFKLKEWLTVAEAARHLTSVFDEEVGEADILRLALDGKLKLSVNFVNGGNARIGRVVPIAEATYEDMPSLFGDYIIHHYRGPTLCTNGETTHVVELADTIVSLTGVFDLPMLGSERLDVEHRFQMLTGGPEITLGSLDGTFVEGADGALCQLQKRINQKQRAEIAALVRQDSSVDLKKLDSRVSRKPLEPRVEELKNFPKQVRFDLPEDFDPAFGLPANCAWVVRTRELVGFVRTVNGEVLAVEKDLTTRVRDTLLKLVIGMAIKGYGHDPLSLKSPAPKEIESDLAQLGLNVSDDTVRKYLQQAAVVVLPERPRQR